jgi:PKD repeat protein
MATRYVNNATGSNANAGTSSGSPWKTLAYAYTNTAAGDTIYLQSSTWNEALDLKKANQTWAAQSGHTPILDGRYHDGLFRANGTLPAPNDVPNAVVRGWTPMLNIDATGINVIGLTIQNSGGRGMYVASGNDIKIRNNRIDFTYDAGLSSGDTGPLKTGCEITGNVITRSTFKAYDPTKNGNELEKEGVSQSMKVARYKNVLVSGNICAYSAGEGIDLGKGSEGIVCENNISFNHRHIHIYMMYSKDTIVRNNLVFFAGNLPQTLNGKGKAAVGISIRDEVSGAKKGYPAQSGAQIYNNIVIGNGALILIDGNEKKTTVDRLWIAYNTLVGGPLTEDAALLINQPGEGRPPHRGIVENNVIDMRFSHADGRCTQGSYSSGLVFRNNCWSKQSEIAATRGANDQVGSPALANAGATLTATWSSGPGAPATNINPNNYKLTSSSTRCIDLASNGSAAGGFTPPALNRDYFGASRGANKDIGAHEFGGVVANDIAASFAQSPSSGAAPLTVQFNDTSQAYGAAVINSWSYNFGDGTTSTQRNPAKTYTVAGTYQVTLTVQDTALGLTSTYTGPLITVGSTPTDSVTANFSLDPASGVAPLEVQFTDASTTTGAAVINSRTWFFGDGDTATTTNPTHTYTTPGVYQPALVVEDTVLGLTNTYAGLTLVVEASTIDSVIADFSATPLSGVAPLAVTFTDESSDTGAATIDSYAWDFGDGGTSTTASPGYTYATPGVYYPQLTVSDTALGLSDTHAGAAVIVTAPGGGATVAIRQTRAALRTSDGSQTITAAGLGGLIPSRAILRLTGATADNTAADGSLMSVGFVTSQSNQAACVVASQHGAATTNGARWMVDGACLVIIDANGAEVGRATFTGWVADGLEMSVDWTGTPAAYLVTVEFAGGTEYQAYAALVTVGGVGSTLDVSGGFAPDAARFATTWAMTPQPDATIAFGLAHREGVQYGIERHHADGLADASLTGRFYDNYVLPCRYTPTTWGTVGATAWTGSALTLTVAGGQVNNSLMVLLEKFGTSRSTAGLLTSGSGTQTETLGWTPQAVMHLASTRQEMGTKNNATSGTLGLHSVTADGEYTDTISGEHGAATTDEQSLSDNALTLPGHDGATVGAATTALAATGYTITWGTAPATAVLWPRLAVEVGTSIATLTADFTAEPRAGSLPLTVQFTDLSGPDVTSWLWSFGDGATSTEQNPEHTYTEGAFFTVSLAVSDGTDTAEVTKSGYIAVTQRVRRRVIIGPYLMTSVTPTSRNETQWAADSDEVPSGSMSAALELDYLPLRDDPDTPTAEGGVVKIYNHPATGDLKRVDGGGAVGTIDVT